MLSKVSLKNAMKSRRVSNAYMLYVKDQKKELIEKCPEESKNVIGAFFGEAWRSLGKEEKKVYFDKYEFLKKLDSDNNVLLEAGQMKPKKEFETIENSKMDEVSNPNPDAAVEEVKNVHLIKREYNEAFDPSGPESKKFIKVEHVLPSASRCIPQVSASKSKYISQVSASMSKYNVPMSASTSKFISQLCVPTSKSNAQMSASTSKFICQVSASSSKNNAQMSSSTNKNVNEFPALTNERTSSVESIGKQKQKKKHRRCNPFMLFAKEKRGHVGPSYAKDKKCHASTVLGQMWKGLPSSEKIKYVDEAKLINSLQNPDSASSSGKTQIKGLKKKSGKKSVGRPFKKAKTLIPAHIPNLRSMKNEEPEKESEVTFNDHTTGVNQSSSVITNGENTAARNGSSESSVPTDVPNVGCPQTNNDMRSCHQLPSTSACNQTRNCLCFNTLHHLHTDHNGNDLNTRPDGAMTRPWAGAGFAPPFVMPYPISNSFWMYQQMQMYQQMYMQQFSQSYCCNSPYSNYYRNMYYSTYFSGRNSIPYYAQYQPMSSAAAFGFYEGEEMARAPANDRNSDDEMVIVDEENADERTVND